MCFSLSKKALVREKISIIIRLRTYNHTKSNDIIINKRGKLHGIKKVNKVDICKGNLRL